MTTSPVPSSTARSPRQRRALSSFVKLMRAARWASTRASKTRADAGLTEGQFSTLEALYHLGPLVQAELARKLLTSTSNLTCVIDNLERDGYVRRRRSATDGRCVEVHLLPRGRDTIHRIFPRHAERIADVMGGLSAEDQERLGELCRTLGRHAEAME